MNTRNTILCVGLVYVVCRSAIRRLWRRALSLTGPELSLSIVAMALLIVTALTALVNKLCQRQTKPLLTIRDRHVQQRAGESAWQRQQRQENKDKAPTDSEATGHLRKRKNPKSIISSNTGINSHSIHNAPESRRNQVRNQAENALGTDTSPPPSTAFVSRNSLSTGTDSDMTNTVKPGLVCQVGITNYCYIPILPHARMAAGILRRLADEFAVIIQLRGYQLRSVSELCCCGSGLDYGELGGHRQRLPTHQRINGVEQINCSGYNRTTASKNAPRPYQQHTIHLRLRQVHDHAQFRPYKDIVETMCHELAHNEHQNHGPAFFQTMSDIQGEYYLLRSNNNNSSHNNTQFDIYASFAATGR